MNYLDNRELLSLINSGDNTAFIGSLPQLLPPACAVTPFVSVKLRDSRRHRTGMFSEILGKTEFVHLHGPHLAAVFHDTQCMSQRLKHLYIEDNYRLDYLASIDGEERLYQVDFNSYTDHPLLYKELQTQIKYVIDHLPDRCREVFLMSRFQGLKNREIAEQLQISTTAVEKHLSKAIKAFTKHFQKNYPTDIYLAVMAWLLS